MSSPFKPDVLTARDINTSAPSTVLPPFAAGESAFSPPPAATGGGGCGGGSGMKSGDGKRDENENAGGNGSEGGMKNMEYHRQVLQSKMAADGHKVAYISPSDTIMSPCTAKLAAKKNKHFMKGKPQSLFAKTSSKNLPSAMSNPFTAASIGSTALHDNISSAAHDDVETAVAVGKGEHENETMADA